MKHIAPAPDVSTEDVWGYPTDPTETTDAACDCYICDGLCQEFHSSGGDYCSCDERYSKPLCPSCSPLEYAGRHRGRVLHSV